MVTLHLHIWALCLLIVGFFFPLAFGIGMWDQARKAHRRHLREMDDARERWEGVTQQMVREREVTISKLSKENSALELKLIDWQGQQAGQKLPKPPRTKQYVINEQDF